MGSTGALTSPMVPGRGAYKGQEPAQKRDRLWDKPGSCTWSSWWVPCPTGPQWDVLDGPCGHLQVPSRTRNPSSQEEEPSCFAAGPAGAAVFAGCPFWWVQAADPGCSHPP